MSACLSKLFTSLIDLLAYLYVYASHTRVLWTAVRFSVHDTTREIDRTHGANLSSAVQRLLTTGRYSRLNLL